MVCFVVNNYLQYLFLFFQHHFDGQYYGFLPVTYVPYEPKLINVKMLSPQHVSYI